MLAEQALDSLSKEFTDSSLALISYNSSFSPSTINTERRNFYTITSDPAVIFDGTDSIYPAGNYYATFKPFIEAAKTVTPFFNLVITAIADSSFGSVALRFVTADTLPEDNIVACLAICQDSIHGIKDFNYVCYQFYSFPLVMIYPDTLDTTITFSHNLLASKLRAVAFTQDLDTKEIMQAITTKFQY